MRLFLLIFLVGFTSSIAQIVILRELLVVFHGNELSTGFILACWLLWTAVGSATFGRLFRHRSPGATNLLYGFALLSAMLPATVIWVRAARMLWSLPVGELISPWAMVMIATTVTGPICCLSGALFALACKLASASFESTDGAGSVYLTEAVGACAGGLFFYFVLLPASTPFGGSLIVFLISLASVFAIVTLSKKRRRILLTTCLSLVLLACARLLQYSMQIEQKTRGWEWGRNFLQSRDTPYHNLTFVYDGGQFSLFSNGLWLYSSPDRQSAEPAAHIPLLSHPDPKSVLIIGSCSPEMLQEVVKHPGVLRVDNVQQERALAEFASVVLQASFSAEDSHPRVRMFYVEPNRFMREAKDRYDVVLLSMGEPVNAEMNRFYTVEFFTGIKRLMNPGGIFSFGVPCAPDIIGLRQALLLKSLNMTLQKVFGFVFVMTGEGAHFLASDDIGFIPVDPRVPVDRIRERGLDLQYVRDYYLFDLLNPIRVAYVDSVIGADIPARVNEDFKPVCYLYGLGLWSAQIHPLLGKIFDNVYRGIDSIPLTGIGIIFCFTVFLVSVFFGRKGAVVLSTGICGATLIVLEIVLIVSFQIMEGSAYTQLALIVSFFMAGLACGSAIAKRGFFSRKPMLRLFVIQSVLASYCGILFLGLSYFRSSLTMVSEIDLSVPFFLLAAFLAGLLGGGQYTAAVATGRASGTGLYAADLVGAAGGAISVSLFFLPVFGVPNTLLLPTMGGFLVSTALLIGWKEN